MLPERIPAASAISRTVVARKPFCANSSLAILTMSARRCDRAAPFPAGASTWLEGWLLRIAPIAPLWLASPQPPKRLFASRCCWVQARLGRGPARTWAGQDVDRLVRRQLRRGRIAGGERGTRLIGEGHRDEQLLAGQGHPRIRLHQEPALEPAAALDQQLDIGSLGQARQPEVVRLTLEEHRPVVAKPRRAADASDPELELGRAK